MIRRLLLTLLIGLTAAPSMLLAAEQPADEALLFTSFRGNGEEGLRLAYSEDGYHWTDIPGTFLKPNAGSGLMRDPSLARGPDGTFHLVWTTAWRGDNGFGHASSKDLIHWSDQQFVPVMEHEPTTVNVWAPELFYDGRNKQFVILWASTIPGRFPDHQEETNNNHRMYSTTTKDFREFAPTELFLDPDFSVIDCTIVRRGEQDYVLVLKSNTRPERKLRVAFGDNPLGPWHDMSPPFTKHLTEGPTVARVGNDWLIYYDSYGDGTYGAARTRDFKTFEDVSDQITLPEGHKHGTICPVPRSQLDVLLKHAQAAAASAPSDSSAAQDSP